MLFHRPAPAAKTCVLVRARLLTLAFVMLLALAGLPAAGQEWEEPTEEDFKLGASDGEFLDRFAADSLSIDGTCLVVGAPWDGDNGFRSGSAYVFRFDPEESEWTEEQKLTPIEAEASDQFGSAVSAYGEVLLVGAWTEGEGLTRPGAAYVYRFDSDEDEWVEEQKLTASDGESGDSFGYAVSISDELLVVGARKDDDDDAGDIAGSTYVFRFDPDSEEWVEEQKLTAGDAAANDYFGAAVSISGERLIVGAYRDDDNEKDSGSAYVFHFDSDSEEWVEEQKLTASDGKAGYHFGNSVSIDEELLIVGSRRDDTDAENTGSAYVFRFDSATNEWVEEQKLRASDGGEGDWFGYSVDLSGEGLVVGTKQMGDDENRGAAYVFRYDPVTEVWAEKRKLTASGGAPGQRFGVRASITGERVAVSGSDDLSGRSAYIFELAIPEFLRGDANGSGAVDALPDALFLLRWQFTGGDKPPCMDAADCDDSGTVSAIPDALFLLRWGFADGDAPPAPGTDECGVDPGEEPDETSCDEVSKACD